MTMESFSWYAQLIKPSWAPPSEVFAPVWAVLYLIIAVTFGYVFFRALRRTMDPMVAVPFALNLLFNAAFTPLQFGLQNNLLAAADILLMLCTLIWAMIAIYPHAKWITYAQIPYLVWVAFATVLQGTITYLNF